MSVRVYMPLPAEGGPGGFMFPANTNPAKNDKHNKTKKTINDFLIVILLILGHVIMIRSNKFFMANSEN